MTRNAEAEHPSADEERQVGNNHGTMVRALSLPGSILNCTGNYGEKKIINGWGYESAAPPLLYLILLSILALHFPARKMNHYVLYEIEDSQTTTPEAHFRYPFYLKNAILVMTSCSPLLLACIFVSRRQFSFNTATFHNLLALSGPRKVFTLYLIEKSLSLKHALYIRHIALII